MDDNQQDTVAFDIPPEDTTPSDISPLSPDATEDVSFGHSETYQMLEQAYWERISLTQNGLADQLRLTMTLEQMRRWVQLFEDYVHRRNKALDDSFRDAWCQYAVTVEKYPHRPVNLDEGIDPDPKENGHTPVEADTVATAWTEKAAMNAKQSLLAGDHPDYDPMDFDCEFYVRVEPIPLLGEGQTPPWGQE